MTSHPTKSPHLPTLGVWLLLLLFAWCLASCKTTRQTSSSESSRNATSQTQWRYARLFSSDSICRLTALSFDSCRITFAMSGKTDIHEDAPSSYPTSSASSSPKAKPSSSHAKPKAHNKAKPSTSKATATPLPSSLTIYGLHFAQSDETKSVSQSTQSDSTSIEAQSSNDKSKQQTKAREPFIPIKLITLIALFMAVAIIFLIRRHRSAKYPSSGINSR